MIRFFDSDRKGNCHLIELPSILVRTQVICLAAVSYGCSTTGFSGRESLDLKPFVTDGCSLFPDGTCREKTKWRECCVAHDGAYWQGGSREERRKADRQLERCVREKTGGKGLGRIMHGAVRVFGSPVFPTWYRWGYGWPYGRLYRPLNPDELRQVRRRLRQSNQKLSGQIAD